MKTKQPLKFYLAALIMLPLLIFAQNTAINEDNSDAHPSAILDVKSSDKGFLMSRMTAEEIASIDNPANGLIVFSTTDNKFYAYILSEDIWKEIAYGAAPTWACGDVLTDTRDSQSYSTVQIGTQCWMAENLNIGTMINGSGNQTNNSTIEKYCYDNNTANCDIYGGLYQWDEMMEYVTTEGTQGICPPTGGWHVPSDAELCILENEVDAGIIDCNSTGNRGTDAGGNLKETGTTHWASPNTGATNASGFNGLPEGDRNPNGSFFTLTIYARFWSSTESDGSNAWRRLLSYNHAQVYRAIFHKEHGISVRCVRD